MSGLLFRSSCPLQVPIKHFCLLQIHIPPSLSDIPFHIHIRMGILPQILVYQTIKHPPGGVGRPTTWNRNENTHLALCRVTFLMNISHNSLRERWNEIDIRTSWLVPRILLSSTF